MTAAPASPGHNLPAELTSFVGRRQELDEVQTLLDATRLVTLTGAGGAGKTRLALRVAAARRERYADGVWLTELASLADPRLVPREVAAALGLRDVRQRELTEALLDFLLGRSLLLVLDNCEHLVAACAELAEALLRGCPTLQILATSREPLGAAGEAAWRVPSLALPEQARLAPSSVDVNALAEYEAVRLFLERARSTRPDFQPTGAELVGVAQLCRRLDGIPLAIELAAARVRVLSVDQLAARLDDRFSLLTGGRRTALPRQQTLRATIEWSVNLLTQPEQVLLRRLSVFAGGWTLETAEAVCEGGFRVSGSALREDGGDFQAPGSELPEDESAPRETRDAKPESRPREPSWLDVLDLLARLVDRSLVQVERIGSETRFRLLETVRQYAAEQLVAAGEADALERRHAEHFQLLAERAEAGLEGPEQGTWLARLEQEHDNIRAALAQSLDEAGTASPAQAAAARRFTRLAAALRWFWWHRCHYEEGSRWLQAAQELFADDPTAAELDREAALTRARTLSAAGHLAWGQGNYARATALLEAGLTQARLLGDDRECAYVLSHLAAVAVNRGEYDRAEQLSWQAIEHCRAAGATWQLALSLYWLAFAARARGDLEQASALQQESLALRRELGDTWGTAWSLHLLGRVAQASGELERAEALLSESLKLHRQIDHQRGIAWCLVDLGLLARARGQPQRAAELLRESLQLTRVQGDRSTLARCLEALAGLALDAGRAKLSALLLGAAEALRAAIQAPLAPADRSAQERTLAALSRLLGQRDLAAALAEGRRQPLEAAVAAALVEPLQPTTQSQREGQAPAPAGLSARELEVLRLLAEGCSNQEIADRLVLSVSTVERHLTHVYTKIGARGRAEAATFASRHGLLGD